jgi:hypothetical protein
VPNPPHLSHRDASQPLGGKAYYAIPHLPGSRLGPSDRQLDGNLARICTERARDGRDEILVLEKLDGSCVVVARQGGRALALGREGKLASASRYPMRRLFADWVTEHQQRFLSVLEEGERLAGEWLALAHGTRYALRHEPFVAFDLLRGPERAPYDELCDRAARAGLTTPGLVHRGGPLTSAEAMAKLGQGFHGALDPVEGAVWRVERSVGRSRRVDFLAKYVRQDKRDGSLLPELTGAAPVWNWQPEGNCSHVDPGAGDNA